MAETDNYIAAETAKRYKIAVLDASGSPSGRFDTRHIADRLVDKLTGSRNIFINYELF